MTVLASVSLATFLVASLAATQFRSQPLPPSRAAIFSTKLMPSALYGRRETATCPPGRPAALTTMQQCGS